MQPLRFSQILKQIRWGGTRLGTVLGKKIGQGEDFAESWEVVDHGIDQSVVSEGEWKGSTLAELVAGQSRALFGRHTELDQFPLLIKYLDAKDALSVQVHPDDRQAREFDSSESGKSEAWVIIEAASASKVFVGLKSGVDEVTLRRNIEEGTVENCLHSYHVSSGDCVFIPAGTVHAIGAGILLAEVQQSSNLTFRLHDWGRLGVDGKARALHIEQAMACTNFQREPVGVVQSRRLTDEDHEFEELVHSEFFILRRHRGPSEFRIEQDDRFHILMMLSGKTDLSSGEELSQLALGETVLLPAERPPTQVSPAVDGVILQAFLP